MSKFKDYYPEAERLAVKEGKSQREISDLLGISEKTLSQWSVKGAWMKQRKEYLISTKIGPVGKLKDRFAKLLEETEVLDARKTDEIYKIQLLIDRMEGGFDIKGATIEVMDRFTKFIRQVEQDKGFLEKLMNHIHKYFDEIKEL